MGNSLYLYAETQATLHLKGGVNAPFQVKEEFRVYATPAEIARQICDAPSFEDGSDLYKSYILEQHKDPYVVFDPNDPTLRIDEKGDLVGGSGTLTTVGGNHISKLQAWIVAHNGWDVYWEYF